MQKRPSSRTRGSARVDAILRYRNASEGVLCSSRCRELSRSGLTATMDRPVYPGELLRIDLEPPSGGPSVLGLARVAWTGSDPEGAPGTSIMRMRFLSLGEASETALFAWLDELRAVAERPSSPHDDSSVRALSRAIADSLLPPPPVLPGAVPSDESSGLSPVPIAVPNRPLIPPPPGMYARSTHTLSHPIDYVGPAAHDFGASAASTPAPDRMSEPPPLPSQRGAASSAPANPGEASHAGEASRALHNSPATRRTAEVRDRLSRLQRRRDQTPLVVPLDARRPIEMAPVETPVVETMRAHQSSPHVARMPLSPPLPLGMLLNAPPETTRRSTPPPAGPVPPPIHAPSSSSWPALRVPPAVAAIAPRTDESPAPQHARRATIPPPATIAEMPSLRVSSPPVDEPERASLPIDGPSLPLSDAPWSVPALPPDRPWLAPRWVALGLASLTIGGALAYVAYGPMFMHRAQPQAAAPLVDKPSAAAQSAADALEHDRTLAADMAVPAQPRADVMNAPEGSSDSLGPIARDARKPQHPKLAAAVPAAKSLTPPAPVVAAPPAAAPKAQPAPQPGDVLTPAPTSPGLPPPPPALPAALAAPAAASVAAPATAPAASKVDRARACLARGDNDCAAKLLKGASTESELELWIETLRAQGRAVEARRDMQRFVDTYPDGRRTAVYRRILSNAP